MCSGAIPSWVLFHIPCYHPQEESLAPTHPCQGTLRHHPYPSFPSLPLLAREVYLWAAKAATPHPTGKQAALQGGQGQTSRLMGGQARAAGSLAKFPPGSTSAHTSLPVSSPELLPTQTKAPGEQKKGKGVSLDWPNRTTCTCKACAGGRPCTGS